jgi:hypothetical protein
MNNTQNESNKSDIKFQTEEEIYVNNKSDIKSLTEQERNDKFVAWHDVDINACRWLTLKNVNPKEAAMLLCKLNPLEDKNPELIFVDADESSPNRYLLLLRAFEDLASLSDSHRTLEQWRQIAKDFNLSCHPWIDNYLEISDISDEEVITESNTKLTNTIDEDLKTPQFINVRTNGNKKTLLKNQQEIILEVIIESMGLDPMAIPSGAKSNKIQLECENKHAHLFKGSSSFERAWKLGRQDGLWKMEYHDSYARRGK